MSEKYRVTRNLIIVLIITGLLTAVAFAAPAISLVLDRSGSMGFSNYMNPAKQRASVFVGLMEIGDHVSVVSFNDESSVNYANAVIADGMTITQVQNAINQISSTGRTSMGSGIYASRSQLNNSIATGQKAMLLLSDGWDNVVPFAIHAVPNIPASIDVYTIALGPNSDVGLLQWIANQTGGTYHMAPNAGVLQDIYDAITADVRGYETFSRNKDDILPLTENIHESVIDAGTERVFFVISTEEEDIDSETGIILSLVDPNGVEFSEDNLPLNGQVDYVTGFAYKYYEILDPQPGTWQMVVSGAQVDEELAYFVRAYGESNLKLELSLESTELATEEPLVLSAALTDNGNPITGSVVSGLVTPPSSEDAFEIAFQEISPGIYEAAYYDTESAGSYNVVVYAQADSGDQIFQREKIASYNLAPPDIVPAPILLHPLDYAASLDVDIEFVWTPVLDADYYQLQIADNQQILIDVEDIEQNTITIDSLEYGSDYMWRVRAVVDGVSGSWSGEMHFSTGIPDIPVPTNLDGYYTNEGALVYWEHSEEHPYYGEPNYYYIYRNDYAYAYIESSLNSYLDTAAYPGNSYTYYVVAGYSGNLSLPSNSITITATNVDNDVSEPLVTAIIGNYPNPFNPQTTIQFSLATAEKVQMVVFDIKGRIVNTLVDETLEAGHHKVTWNGIDNNFRPASSGIYFVRMVAAGNVDTTKILLLK
jgi:hypothetical protein